MALHPSPRVGAPSAGESGLIVFDVQLVSSGEANGAQADEPLGEEIDNNSTVAQPHADAPQPEPLPPVRSGGSGAVGDATTERPMGASMERQPSANTGALRSAYQSTLFAHVMRYRYYPEAARPDRLAGVVRVQFAMSRDGRIMTAWVETSSGHALLDEAALDALRRAQPLPAIPPELPDEMEVLLPLDYLPPRVILAG